MMPDTTLLSAVRPRRVRPLLTAGVVWAALAVPVASGQTTDIIPAPPDPRPYVRLDAVGVLPTGGLSTRFGPTATAALAYGWWLTPARRLEVEVTGVRFPKGDLRLSGDTTAVGSGDVSPDSIDVSLSLVGAGVRFHQRVASFGRASARVVVGGGFTRWVDRRGAYPSRGLAEGTRRAQWSGEFVAGAGLDVPMTARLALVADARYHFLPADLWGAQQVRLRPVSTLQYATLGVGVAVAL